MPGGAPARQAKRASGFSLLEVLVAFVILALVATALFRLFSGALVNAGAADDYSRVALVAQSALDEASLPPLREGTKDGAADDGRVTWVAHIAQYKPPGVSPDLEAASDALPLRLWRIVVDVTFSGPNGAPRTFTLATTRARSEGAMSAPAEGRSAKRLSARDWLTPTQAAQRIASSARRRGATRRRIRAFTLLEMTIALMLFALMAAVLFGSLRIAGRSWDSGETKAAQTSDIRQTEQFLREHLASQYPQRLRKLVDLPLIFSGAHDEIRYAASLPARVDEGGVYFFRLLVAKDGDHSRLVLERMVPDLDSTSGIDFRDPQRSVLAEDIDEIRIDYLGRDPGSADAMSPTWHDRWDDKQKLPMLIRIAIRPLKGAAWPPLVVEPRRAPEAGCRQWEPVQQRCVGQT